MSENLKESSRSVLLIIRRQFKCEENKKSPQYACANMQRQRVLKTFSFSLGILYNSASFSILKNHYVHVAT